MRLKWPEKIVKEYNYFNNNKRCQNAASLNEAFGLREHRLLIEDFPPCFFAGRVGESQFVLIGLNPGFNWKRSRIERRIYSKHGWEDTYFSFLTGS